MVRPDSSRSALGSEQIASCGTLPGEDLLVFVGRKLEVQELPYEPPDSDSLIMMDMGFRARYGVLDVFCGEYDAPEIEFDAYDHYGTPAFAAFETVLLFVSRYEGTYYHEKYQFFDVYETIDGSWAGCGDPYKYEIWEGHRGPLRARPIAFANPPTFRVDTLDPAQIDSIYPETLFTRRGDSVVCQAGSPIAELFMVKRDGVLKARKMFR